MYLLIKWLFYKNLGSSIVFLVVIFLSRRLVCRRLITTFDLSLAYSDVVFFIILFRYFTSVGAIQTSKADSINFLGYFLLEITSLHLIFFLVYLLIKWLFYKDLSFFYCHCFIAAFGLSLSYYDVRFVIGLFRCSVFHRFVSILYLCGGNPNKQSGFNRF